MRSKRIVSIVLALLFMLTMATHALADKEQAYALKLEVDSKVITGQDFTVKVKIVTPEVSQGVGFNLIYDAEKVEYKGFEGISVLMTNVALLEEGKLELASVMDGKQYNDDIWVELRFTAKETAKNVVFSTVYSGDAAFFNASADQVAEEDIDFGTAKTDIVRVPTYKVNLDTASKNYTGADFDVTVKIVTPGTSMGVGFYLIYDAENLEYKGFKCIGAPAANSNVTALGSGKLELASVMDGKQYKDDVWMTLTFNAKNAADAVEFITAYSEDAAFMDLDASVVEEADIDFGTATIKLVDAHTAPTFAVAIDGDGVVGKALSANITDYNDNWGLEPEYAYSWKLDGEEVSKEETYTPDADAIDKIATVTVVATVDAEENATSDAVTSAEVEIIPDETAQASVENVKLNPEQPKGGTPVTVEYTFVPSVNGGEDVSEIEWYNAAQPADNEEPAELAGKVSLDQKTYTPAQEDCDNNVILAVRVIPKGTFDSVSGASVVFVAEAPVSSAISPESISIIKADPYEYSGKTLISVAIGEGVINPAAATLTIGEDKEPLFYSPVKKKYYGIVDSTLATDPVTAAENIEIIGNIPSDTVYFGVLIEKEGKEAPNAQDFSMVLQKYLRKPVALTQKQFIATDVAAEELDGKFNASDFSELLKLYLKKSSSLPVNVQ